MVKYKQENPTGTLVRRRKEEKDSMRSVRQKYISLILILSMFFLGMCCGSTQADSSLMYGILHHTDSVFVNSGVDELPEQLSNDTTERMLSANAYLQSGRQTHKHTHKPSGQLSVSYCGTSFTIVSRHFCMQRFKSDLSRTGQSCHRSLYPQEGWQEK